MKITLTQNTVALNSQLLRRRKIAVGFIQMLLLFSLLLANGCSGNNTAFWPTPTYTSTPTMTCPPIAIDTQSSLQSSPILAVVLFEQQTETNSWAYTAESFQIMRTVLSEAAEPGDRFIFYLLGPRQSDFQHAYVDGLSVGSASRPDIPSTPTLEPTATATIVPTGTMTGYFALATKDAANATQAALLATATHSAFINNCAMGIWATQYADVATQWVVTRASALDQFMDQYDKRVHEHSIDPDRIVANQVYEGLTNAAESFKQECNSKYRRCTLIIFSDLTEWRPKEPDGLAIKFDNVDVISVMLNCNPIYSPDCQAMQETWNRKFSSYHARTVQYINGDNVEQNLIQLLRR